MTKKRKGSIDLDRAPAKTHEFLDFDYLDSLPEAERDYLVRFCREFYSARFGHKNQLHPPERRKECYAANNARERDIWNKGERLDDSLDTLPTEDDDSE